MTECAIADIVVGERHRRDLGDVGALAANIADVGLLHPIVITPDDRLIAGERRLEAYKRLGRTHIPVTIVPLDDIVRGELAENAERKDFLPSEIDAIRRALEPIERAAAKRRMSEGGKVGQISTPSAAGRTRDKIAGFAGVSGRTVAKIAAVCEAVEQDPRRFGHLRDELDRHRGVDRAYRALHIARDQERVLGTLAAAGRHRTLVVDPPWAYDLDFLGRGAPKYALMPLEEILKLPVADWAEEDCHLYLWSTNAMLPHAFGVMARWGFTYKTTLTWAKPKFGLGTHFRGQTEHVLFGIRGTLATRATNISTLFEAPVGRHSEKPEKFYEIVRAASYPPYGEAFQRTTRPDFVNLFVQQITSEAAS
jgi:N6-adenosine-specific RNA methylase IME4